MALVLTITAAGRAALVNAQNTGTAPVTIATVGVSAQALVPTAATAALPGEIKRIATLSGDVVADDTIHLIVRDETSDLYAIRSFALYLADGTLFAAYGQADPIMEKSAQSLLLLAIDVRFVDIAAPDLTFGDASFLNPPATVDQQGVVELATDAEAGAGTDAVRAVTPKGLKSAVTAWLDTRFGAGAPSAFVKGLLLSASAIAFRASLSIKSAALRDEGAGNGLDADLLDGQHGAWYADIPARLGYTPWHLNNDGAGSGLDADLLDGQEGSYYLPAATYTAADALTKLKSVDGAGSGLDADLLDGKEGAAYALLAGAAFTGSVSAAGNLSATARVDGGGGLRGTGHTFTDGGLGMTGKGTEVGVTAAGEGYVTAIDRTPNTHIPLTVEGSEVRLSASGTVVARASSAGIAVAGTIGASQTIVAKGVAASGLTGPGTVMQYSSGVGYIGAYSDGSFSVLAGLQIDGSYINLRAANATIAAITSTGIAVAGMVGSTALRASGTTGFTTGAGVETFWSAGNSTGFIVAYDREANTSRTLKVQGSSVLIRGHGDVGIADFTTNGLAVTGKISATGDVTSTGAVIASGAVVAGGLVDAQTPNIATTGGVRIRGNQTSGMAYLQFTDAPATAQWGYFSCNAAGLLTWGGNTLWHAGNDGSGSGLDADLLDGQHGNWWRDWNNLLNKPASFPPSAHQHLAADLAGAFTGSMTQNGWVVLPNGLIIQWGRFAASPNTTTRVSFPMTFPSGCFAVSPNAGASGGADSSDNPPVLLGNTVDQLGFTVFSADDATGYGGYIAIGI